MGIVKKLYFFQVIFFTEILLSFINCDEDIMKNSKVLSCVSLSRGALTYEKAAIENISLGFKDTEKKEVNSKILTLLIVKCYRNMSKEKAIEILSEMNTKNQGQEIVWKKEFKTLLGLDGDITDDVDSPTFLDDFKEVNKILKELNDEAQTLKQKREAGKKSSGSSASSASDSKSKQQTKSSGKAKKEEVGLSTKLISWILTPFTVLFRGVVGLIGFDSFFGVGVSIGLIFLLSYFLRVLFSGPSKVQKKNKLTKTE